ncbi:4-alpha-glucanotransferase [Mariprofundus ferrinatatus]|uniref:4-alpha-glucanotransferase n=1 Tax=Mariprofundus ferrinatatus TaxID=1921087 RepID=A0A2K8L4F7_9PROT|nr:4-alpha-glucanotransferase [Mariprofundus ferrinatatus]ATX82208.1 4-alpha-glucanotransferase [Mariprofundus ferrinatatus]
MKSWIDRRRSAVLLHISSLPGPFHKGVLGSEARTFIDRIKTAGFSIWQFLPLGPTHGHGSPYESLSSFAGNPEFIDLRECVSCGWLDTEQLNGCDTAEQHAEKRKIAAGNFWLQTATDTELADSVQSYRQAHAYWLEDYALFSALKTVYQDRAWWQWPAGLRDRNPESIDQEKLEHGDLIKQAIFEQYLFDRQWHDLKAYAESMELQLFGDLPIYVAHDSADVWANRDFFTINEKGLCTEVAGVPPDYFSTTGQRWGNPLYRWNHMQEEGFSWWTERVRQQLERMHMMRIDHFRGLEAFWAIPGESEDGIIGEWRPAPGDALMQTLQEKLGKLPLIAEDLGIITDEVTELRKKYGLPGMKILQFAFGGDDDNPYLPKNHEKNSVVYTGTHDNDTTLGWFQSTDEGTRERALKELHNARAEDMPWAMIECALASVARLAVIPMQDILELGSEAKFNTPGTLDNNWSWRMQDIPGAGCCCWKLARQLNRLYKRI